MATENHFYTNTEEKLYFFHNEIETLRNHCKDENLSDFQIKKGAYCLLQNKKERRNDCGNMFWIAAACISTVCLLTTCLFYFDYSKRLISSIGRLTLIKILPVVDWTALHGVTCFIPNNFVTGPDRLLQKDDCQNCSGIREVVVSSSLTMEEIANNYLNLDVPVIVHDAQPTSSPITLQHIIQLYLDNDVMRLYTSCDFDSNISIKKKDHRNFLAGVRKGEITQFYAHWENCFKEAAKMVRAVYTRPQYLPPSVELGVPNWIFMCSNYTQNKHILVPFEEQVIILLQLSGTLGVTLRPKKPCTKECHSVQATIPEGGTLIVGDFFYDLEYATCNHGNSITVGLGGKLDL